MATVINVAVHERETLVNLETVASIAFTPVSSGSSASARIVTTAIMANRGEDSSGPHVLNVTGDDDVAALRSELVKVGWLPKASRGSGIHIIDDED